MSIRVLSLLLLWLPATLQATEKPYILTWEAWSVPRSAESLIRMPALSRAVAALRATPGAMLVLRYPGGDAGTLWVNELESWLVALGIPRAQLDKTPGSPDPQRIELEVSRPLVPASGVSDA